MQNASLPPFDFTPYRLSGQVVGVLMNDQAALAALGEAVHAPPYKAPPVAPVLYVKPRNTLVSGDGSVALPAGVAELEVGATLGLLIGRTACRVNATDALSYVAGLTLAADLSVPHASFYRPSVRFKALDGSCRLSSPVPLQGLDPDGQTIEVQVDGQIAQRATTRGFNRTAAQLIADVSAFMTLRPGDLLLTGVPHGAPRVRAGQRVRLAIASVLVLDLIIVPEVA